MRLKSYFLFMSRIDFPTKLLLFAHANSSCITFQCWTYLLSISFWIKELLLKTTVLHFLLRNNVLFFMRNLTDCYDYNLFRCRYKHFELVINYDTWNIHWSRSWKKLSLPFSCLLFKFNSKNLTFILISVDLRRSSYWCYGLSFNNMRFQFYYHHR